LISLRTERSAQRFVRAAIAPPRASASPREIHPYIGLIVLSALLCPCGCSPNAPTTSDSRRAEQQTSELSIYVADWANHRIVRMHDMQGNGWTTLGGPSSELQLRFPVGIALDPLGRLLVSEQYHHRLLRMNDMTGAGIVERKSEAQASSQVNKYTGSWVCTDAQGRIYMTYDGYHRVVRLDDFPGGQTVVFGREGSGKGEFRYPAGIAVDRLGRIYVADFDNFRLVRFDDMQGTNWTALGEYGVGERQFINPCGVCLDGHGRIYVADQGNDRIVRIDDLHGSNWTTIGSFGTERKPGQLYAPTGICVDREGRIYVTQSSSNHAIVRMDDMQGTNWTVFGAPGSDYGQFASPMGIAVLSK
jgi:DNA-binding beta-propeller fold protein YncE